MKGNRWFIATFILAVVTLTGLAGMAGERAHRAGWSVAEPTTLQPYALWWLGTLPRCELLRDHQRNVRCNRGA